VEDARLRVANLAAVDTLQQRHFITLLMGLSSMPDLQAIQRQLEQLPCHFDRLVFLLNSHDPKLQEALLGMGASYCLSKPVPHSKLLAALLAPQSFTPSHPALPVAKPKLALNVLAVDDNPANLKLITAMLGDLVSEVHSCQNGRQAVELAQRLEFDLIFMDIQMPILDGISAAQAIRQEGCNQQTPIIAVTAHAIPGERERLMAQGMDEYLAKPIDENQLEHLLQLFTQTPSLVQPGLVLESQAIAPSSPNPATLSVAAASTESGQGQLYDAELALRQAAGKPELAREMLELLLASLPETQSLLAQANDLLATELQAGIHKLAGGAAYCGMPALQALCHQLESALRHGETAETLEPELLELQDLLLQLQTHLHPQDE